VDCRLTDSAGCADDAHERFLADFWRKGLIVGIGAAELRDNFADALNRVAYQGERIVLERRGKGVVGLVSMEDLALLERLEDEFDVAEARQALAEKGANIPFDEVKTELGLQGLGIGVNKPKTTAKKRPPKAKA